MTAQRVVGLLLVLAVTTGACGSESGGQGTIQVAGSSVHFSSVDAMAEASFLIVVGTVIEVGDGVFESAPGLEDFLGTQFLKVTIEIEEVLKGDRLAGDRVSISWAGYDVALDSTKGPQQIVEGQVPPESGNRNLWFLIDQPTGLFIIAYEGRLKIDDGGKLRLANPVESGAADKIGEMTVAEVAELLSLETGR